MKILTVEATRSGKWWALQAKLSENDTIFSQCRRIDQIEPMIRDALSLFPEYDQDLEISVVYRLPNRETQIKKAVTAAETAREAAALATKTTRATVSALQEDGLSVRDIGILLGVSPQRVSQIAKTATS